MMCRAAHMHVGTLFPDTCGGARKGGEPGTHEEEAYAVKSQEDRRKQKEDRDGKSLRGDRA